ncbi:MAG TPA: 3-isopropylmalate dehydratase small subunit [Acetobacteraceae bacterium]|nr:3-isopropylmalate dehydratase small subunit [Acetobacteraceae bacterium]
MRRFTKLTSVAVPFDRPNIDTDQVIPARYLQKPRDGTLGQYLFHDLRFGPDGAPDPTFVLNQPAFRDAAVLVAAQNFGCGSSRENAVWALQDYGFQAAIAPSFGDIFRNNSLKNGLLPVVLPENVVSGLLGYLREEPGAMVAIDLEAERVTLPDGTMHRFEIDPFARHCLLNGVDELAFTLSQIGEIEAFERRYGRENF